MFFPTFGSRRLCVYGAAASAASVDALEKRWVNMAIIKMNESVKVQSECECGLLCGVGTHSAQDHASSSSVLSFLTSDMRRGHGDALFYAPTIFIGHITQNSHVPENAGARFRRVSSVSCFFQFLFRNKKKVLNEMSSRSHRSCVWYVCREIDFLLFTCKRTCLILYAFTAMIVFFNLFFFFFPSFAGVSSLFFRSTADDFSFSVELRIDVNN